jgi:hypothetical protein
MSESDFVVWKHMVLPRECYFLGRKLIASDIRKQKTPFLRSMNIDDIADGVYASVFAPMSTGTILVTLQNLDVLSELYSDMLLNINAKNLNLINRGPGYLEHPVWDLTEPGMWTLEEYMGIEQELKRNLIDAMSTCEGLKTALQQYMPVDQPWRMFAV